MAQEVQQMSTKQRGEDDTSVSPKRVKQPVFPYLGEETASLSSFADSSYKEAGFQGFIYEREEGWACREAEFTIDA